MNQEDQAFFAGRRRAIISMGGVLLMLFILGGRGAIFGLFFVAEHHAADQIKVDELFQAASTASKATIAFKRQVQEWKDILLRGSKAEDFKTYSDAFHLQNDQVGTMLRRLSEIEPQGQRADVDQMILEHAGLVERYLGALGDRRLLSHREAEQIDHELRGIDRTFTERLDTYTADINERYALLKEAKDKEDLERYQQLERFNMGIMAFGVVLVLVLLLWFRQQSFR